MPLKVKGLINLDKRLKKLIPDAKSNFAIVAKRSIVDIIVEKILTGVSPVSGQNRYPNYSDGYAKKKGRKSPVDLLGEGDMLNNMSARQTTSGNIIIEFKDSLQRKKAQAHNFGLNNQPMRKMVPTGNETFKKDIQNKIVDMVRQAIRKAIG